MRECDTARVANSGGTVRLRLPAQQAHRRQNREMDQGDQVCPHQAGVIQRWPRFMTPVLRANDAVPPSPSFLAASQIWLRTVGDVECFKRYALAPLDLLMPIAVSGAKLQRLPRILAFIVRTLCSHTGGVADGAVRWKWSCRLLAFTAVAHRQATRMAPRSRGPIERPRSCAGALPVGLQAGDQIVAQPAPVTADHSVAISSSRARARPPRPSSPPATRRPSRRADRATIPGPTAIA